MLRWRTARLRTSLMATRLVSLLASLAASLVDRWRGPVADVLGRTAHLIDRAMARLPERWQRSWRVLTQEFAKFGTIGVINLFVNFAVFNLLIHTVLRDGELKAKAVAAAVATTSAYFMNRHWTYRDRPKSTLRREYSLFIFFNVVGLLIEVSVVGITKYGLHQTNVIALNISTAIGIALGTLFRFWAYRTHVFKPSAATPEASATGVTAGAAAAGVGTAGLVDAATEPAVDPAASAKDGADDLADSSDIDDIELAGLVTLADEPDPVS